MDVAISAYSYQFSADTQRELLLMMLSTEDIH